MSLIKNIALVSVISSLAAPKPQSNKTDANERCKKDKLNLVVPNTSPGLNSSAVPC
jgi:hypothetical protein